MNQIRFNCRVKTFLFANINGSTYGKILDLSAGGALISADTSLSENDTATLEILMPNYRVKVTGQVVRKAGEKEYGIKFLDLPDQEKAKISDYILMTCKGSLSQR